MRSEAPALLPIFRSQHQADLLTLLLLHPSEEYTATDLANRLEVPLTTIHRETQRLIEADLLTARTVGRSRLLRANTANRVIEPLTHLLTVTFGPHIVLSDAFADIPGIDLLLIYGSWATRYHGEPGPTPNDVDVLVVGHADRTAIYEAADKAEQRLGFPVNPTLSTPRRWTQASDALIQEIKNSPTVVVFDRHNPEQQEAQ
ncbi:MAG: winged helix-turn-helix transcriptional regulator [Longispora sp.]|nr:winged helix-turn-helix transcriptional regulator [Longispora sp. (in: high G+C Gram-positive bacteria)]